MTDHRTPKPWLQGGQALALEADLIELARRWINARLPRTDDVDAGNQFVETAERAWSYAATQTSDADENIKP